MRLIGFAEHRSAMPMTSKSFYARGHGIAYPGAIALTRLINKFCYAS